MDRRDFLRRLGIATTTGYAIEQVELLERMKAPVKYFFGRRVERMQVYTLEATVRDMSGNTRILYMKPDVPLVATAPFVLEKVHYTGPMPEFLERLGVKRVNMPLSYSLSPVSKDCTLTVQLPQPFAYTESGDGDLYQEHFLPNDV